LIYIISQERLQILHIRVGKWKKPVADEIVVELSEETVGYTGADLNSLCFKAVMAALTRTYPQIYETSETLQIDEEKNQGIFYYFPIIDQFKL